MRGKKKRGGGGERERERELKKTMKSSIAINSKVEFTT